MGDPSDMPDLDEDWAAALVHKIGDLAPAGNLLLRIDAGRVLIALALLRDLARFGDQQAGGGALTVIVDREGTRDHAGWHRAVACQGRHHQAIGKRKGTELERLEQFDWRTHQGLSE